MLMREFCYCVEAVPGRGFAALMESYENNYILFRRLCPELDRVIPDAVSVVEGALDLHLQILERSKYTTTVKLTYRFRNTRGRSVPEPDLRVRIYHDARQAEVLRGSFSGSDDPTAEAAVDESDLSIKWKWNRFLNKWLQYCLDQKHRFGPPSPVLGCRVGAPQTASEQSVR